MTYIITEILALFNKTLRALDLSPVQDALNTMESEDEANTRKLAVSLGDSESGTSSNWQISMRASRLEKSQRQQQHKW